MEPYALTPGAGPFAASADAFAALVAELEGPATAGLTACEVEDLLEALDEAAAEELRVGDRRGVEVHGDAARVPVREQHDHRRAARQRGVAVHPLDLRAGDVGVLAQAGHVAGLAEPGRQGICGMMPAPDPTKEDAIA